MYSATVVLPVSFPSNILQMMQLARRGILPWSAHVPQSSRCMISLQNFVIQCPESRAPETPLVRAKSALLSPLQVSAPDYQSEAEVRGSILAQTSTPHRAPDRYRSKG